MPGMITQIALLPETFRPIDSSLIRLGSEFDGGYVVAREAIDRARHLLSFGLNVDWTFEADFARRKQQDPDYSGIHAYDPTLTSWRLCRATLKHVSRRLAGRPVSHIGTLLSYWRFFRHPLARHHRFWISGRPGPDAMNLHDCLASIPPDHPVYVKMDIEGSEYGLLTQLATRHQQIPGLSVEYHEFDRNHQRFAQEIAALHARYFVAHVHVNNYGSRGAGEMPTVLEVSYIRRDLVPRPVPGSRRLPLVHLDRPNDVRRPDYQIRFLPGQGDWRRAWPTLDGRAA
jgi:hypothetical protein